MFVCRFFGRNVFLYVINFISQPRYKRNNIFETGTRKNYRDFCHILLSRYWFVLFFFVLFYYIVVVCFLSCSFVCWCSQSVAIENRNRDICRVLLLSIKLGLYCMSMLCCSLVLVLTTATCCNFIKNIAIVGHGVFGTTY